jgi:hypothetical protein
MAQESSDPLIVRVTVKSTRKSLVWNATGYRYESVPAVKTSEPGGEVQFLLPCTDTAGWRDPELNAIIEITEPGQFTHQYTADVEILAGDRVQRKLTMGPFSVPAGDGVIDLDNTVPASTVQGQMVLIPDVWTQVVDDAASVAADAQSTLDGLAALAGLPEGLATLDEDGVVPEGQLPERLSPDGLDSAIAGSVAVEAPAVGLGQFEIQPMWLFGHSWQANNANATPGARWWERVIKRLGMGAGTVKAISGRTIGDNTVLALSGANAWVPRTKAFVALACTINDLVRFSGSAAGRRAYISAWRAMLSVLTANAAVASDTASFVYSTGWTREAVVGSSSDTSGLVRNSTGGRQWHTETAGRYFEFTFTGTDVDVHLVAKIAGAGLVTFTEGATTLGTLDLTATVAQEVPAIFRIRGLASGTHTIRGTLTSGASLWVDSYRIPSTAPAPILVYGEPPLNWSAYGDQATLDALLTSFKADLATICAEYPSVLYVDLDRVGWDKANMLTVDGIHPNDAGCAWMATQIIVEMAQIPFSAGLNVTGAAYPSAYVAPAGPATPAGGHAGNYIDPGPTPTLPGVDTFNRADASSLGTTSDGSQNWMTLASPSVTGAAAISSNRGVITARTGSSGWFAQSVDTGVQSHKVSGKLASAPVVKHALLFSAVDGSNLLYVYAEGASSIAVGKRLSNVATTIQAGVAATVTSTSVIEASINKDTKVVTVKVDGTTVWSNTVADAPLGTLVAFGVSSSSGSFDGYWDQINWDAA